MEQVSAFPESELRPAGKPASIAPDLKNLHLVSVWDLTHHPRNARKHNLAAIEHGLRTYGQQTPLVVQRSTGYVCKGNGTLRVARDIIGWDVLAVSFEDFDEATALRYLLDDNRASDVSDYDKAALGRLLKELDEGGQMQATLWDLDSAETIWAEMGQLTVTDPEEFRGDYAETPEELEQRQKWYDERRGKHGGGTLREVIIVVKQEHYEEFAVGVARLSRAFDTKSVSETVIECVKRAAAQVVA